MIRINLLPHIDVVGVGDVFMVGNILDDTEALLQAFCKFISCRFYWSSIYTIIYLFCFFPFFTFIIQALHNCQCKWLRLRIGVGFS